MPQNMFLQIFSKNCKKKKKKERNRERICVIGKFVTGKQTKIFIISPTTENVCWSRASAL